MSNQERSFRSCRLRARSESTLERPTRKKPSVTFTARPASGVPRACSLDFIKMPGTLPTPPPEKSCGRMKVNSAVWLAGSDESVLRRNDIVILNLRSGISMSARTAISGFWLPLALIGSVRQITEPTYCFPLGSDGSSSYSTTRCATGATFSLGAIGLRRGAAEIVGVSGDVAEAAHAGRGRRRQAVFGTAARAATASRRRAGILHRNLRRLRARRAGRRRIGAQIARRALFILAKRRTGLARRRLRRRTRALRAGRPARRA